MDVAQVLAVLESN